MSTQASSGDGSAPNPADTQRIIEVTDQDSEWASDDEEPSNPERTRENPESGEGITERTEEQPRPKRTKPKTSFATPPTSPRGSRGSGGEDDSRNNGDGSSQQPSWTSYLSSIFGHNGSRGRGSGSGPSNPTNTSENTAPPPTNPPAPFVEEVRDESETKPDSGASNRSTNPGDDAVRGRCASRSASVARNDSFSPGSRAPRPQTPFHPRVKKPDSDEDSSSGSQGRPSVSDIVKGLFRRKDTQPSVTSTTPQNDTQLPQMPTTNGDTSQASSMWNGWGLRDRFGRFISNGTNMLSSAFSGGGQLSNFGHMMSNPGYAGPHGLFDLMGTQGAYDPSAGPFIDNRTVDDQIKQWLEPYRKLREKKGLTATATSANPSQLTSAFQPSTFGGLQSAMNGMGDEFDTVSGVTRYANYGGKKYTIPPNMTPKTAILERGVLSEILDHDRLVPVPTNTGTTVQRPVAGGTSFYGTLLGE